MSIGSPQKLLSRDPTNVLAHSDTEDQKSGSVDLLVFAKRKRRKAKHCAARMPNAFHEAKTRIMIAR